VRNNVEALGVDMAYGPSVGSVQNLIIGILKRGSPSRRREIMSRKILFVVVVLVFGLSGRLMAATDHDYIGPSGGDWMTAANWQNGLPSLLNSVNAVVELTDVVEIGAGDVAEANNLQICRRPLKDGGKVTMTGGTLNTRTIQISNNSNGGILQVDGGVLTNLGQISVPYQSGRTATVYLNGGTVSTLNLLIQGTTSKVVVKDGTLILTNPLDQTAVLQGHITAGRIVPVTTRGQFVVDFNVTTPNCTTLKFVTELNKAYNPQPASTSPITTGVPLSTTLSWTQGDSAASHHLYIGTDVNAVKNRDVSTDKGIVTSPYTPPAGLALNTVYYWAVDEANGPNIWPGNLWSFKTIEYQLVENFNSYTSTANLRATWSGTSVNLQNLIAKDGNAMALDYSTSPTQTTRTFTTAQDWTAVGIKSLAIYFHGYNVADSAVAGLKMDITLEDASGASATVAYTESDNFAQSTWEYWNIANFDLADFTGVNLSAIKKITIGLNGLTVSGSGAVYIDDIKLYPARCPIPVRETATPGYYIYGLIKSDINGDCTVDGKDVYRLADEWLTSAGIITATPPDSSKLRVHYKFDETSDFYVTNSAGPDPNFDAVTTDGLAHWDTGGQINGCILFDGTFGVRVPADKVFDSNELLSTITISIWIKADTGVYPYFNNTGYIFQGGTWATYRNIQLMSPTGLLKTAIWRNGSNGVFEDATVNDLSAQDFEGQWNHYACVKDRVNGVMRLYINGELRAENTNSFNSYDNVKTQGFNIGNLTTGEQPYYGRMDDFRIYSYALSQAEILTLAGKASSGQKLLSSANAYDLDDVINLKDFAVVAEDWLNKVVWPN
jgi:hypothetical protein